MDIKTKEKIYEIISARNVEVIKIFVNYGNGKDKPIHTVEEYYTTDGVYIGRTDSMHKDL